MQAARRRAMLSMALLSMGVWPFSATDAVAQASLDRAVSTLERKVDTALMPGDDFYAYANDAWLNAAVIPAGRNRWSVRDDIVARTRKQIDALFDEADRSRDDARARMLADFHAALLDSAMIERRGIAPLAPMLTRIAAVRDRRALARLLGATMHADVDPLDVGTYNSASVLGLSVEHSIHGEKSYTPFLLQGGLALGDRDAYLSNEPAAQQKRERYRHYVARMLTLAGFDRAEKRADAVIALETAIAQSQATSTASAVDRNADSMWSRASYAHEAPGMDWDAFFDAAGLARQPVVVAWQPSAVRGVAALVAAQPIETWRDYLRFHLLDDYADVLPKAFAESAAELRGDTGTREQRARAMTESSMAGALGELYAARYFSPAQKARVHDVIAKVTAAFREHAARAEWLSAESRATAVAKVDALYVGIGYPDTRQEWSDLCIDAHDAFGNARRVAERTRRAALARLGKAYDQRDWAMTPQSPGALLIFQQSSYQFAAALLQPPKYDSTASDASVYGAIGAIIGHDVSHFVDVLGADYEADGRMHRWWTTADSARFETTAEPLVRQFSEYEPLPGVHIDGRLTRTENVADLAGLTAAFEAYRASLGARVTDSAYVHAQDRDFFLAFARAFGAKLNDSAVRAQLTNDHAPERYRMNTVRNVDAWYAAFDVRPGQKLYLAPTARVHVW